MLITLARFRAHEQLPSGHYLSWTGWSSPSLFPFTTLALPASLPICFIPDWSHFLLSCVHIYGLSTECPEDTVILNRLIIPFPPTIDFIPTQSDLSASSKISFTSLYILLVSSSPVAAACYTNQFPCHPIYTKVHFYRTTCSHLTTLKMQSAGPSEKLVIINQSS